MRPRSVAEVATAAVLVLALGACVDDGEAAGEPVTVRQGHLTVCSDVPYAPFAMPDTDGRGYTGFDIDLVAAIAGELGLELAVVVTPFDAIESGAAFEAGRCDVAASGITITEERAAHVDFSEPYYDVAQSLLVPAGSDVASLEDLASRPLGVLSATPGEEYAAAHAGVATVVAYEDPDALLTALATGEVDAVLHGLAANATTATTVDGFTVVETYPTGDSYGLAVAEDGSEALLTAIDAALRTLRDTGAYDELHARYFPTG